MALLAVTLFSSARQKDTLPYRDASLPVEQRVSDLLSRMTLQEKIGQLRCTLAWNYYDIIGRKHVVPSASFKKDMAEGHVGMLWATYRADPWTRKTLDNGLPDGVHPLDVIWPHKHTQGYPRQEHLAVPERIIQQSYLQGSPEAEIYREMGSCSRYSDCQEREAGLEVLTGILSERLHAQEVIIVHVVVPCREPPDR